MKINKKFATRAAALLSLGTLFATTACTDYVEEFKEEHKATYGEIVPHDSSEIPLYDFDAAELIWQGYTKNNISTTTSDGGSITLQTQENTKVTFRGKDSQGTNFTTNTLDDVEALIRRSGAIAGTLNSRNREDASAGIIFHFDSKHDLSLEENYSGLVIALGSSYNNVRVCLQSIDENEPDEYIHEYCSSIDDMGVDTLVHAVKVPFADLVIDNGHEEFNDFMSKVDGIKVSFTGKSDKDFGFKIVALGFYHDGSSFLKSSASEEVESSESKKPASSASTTKSSASTAKSSASTTKSSASTAKSSSSVKVSSSSAVKTATTFLWTSTDGAKITVDKYNWKWSLDGNVEDMWMLPAQYRNENPNNNLNAIIDSCNGICANIAETADDSVIINLSVQLRTAATSWQGLCLAYSNTADAQLRLVNVNTKEMASIDLPTTSVDNYNKMVYRWSDFNDKTLAESIVANRSMAIQLVIKNPGPYEALFFNLFNIGSLGQCGNDPITIPTYPKFYKNTKGSYFDFKWVPSDCDTCTNKNSIKMWFDGDTVFSKWESSNPETDQFSSSTTPLTIEQAINEQGGINTFIDSTNNPKFFFKLNEDGSSRDITDWQGICVNYNWHRNIHDINTTAMSYANLTIENGDDHYTVTLPSYPGAYKSRCFKFDEFFITDQTVKASKISISFTRGDNQAEDLFGLIGIGEYKTMTNEPFVDNIVDRCLADRSIVLVGDSAKWHLEFSTHNDMSAENPSYNWKLLDATKLSGETSSFLVSEKEGSITSTVTVSLDNRGIYQQLYCPTVTALPLYTSCKYYTETSKIGYGSTQLIDLENEYGRLPDSLVSITWKDASEDETKGYFAKVDLDKYNTVYVPAAYIEYYNGVKDTIVCDTMKTGGMPKMEACVLSTSLEETAAIPGTEVCWTLSNKANVPAAIISSISFSEDIETQNGAEACKTLDDYGTNYQPTVDIQYTDGTTEKLTCELVNVPELKSTDFLNPDKEYGELTDERDGRVYKTIQIGNQIWMAENLDYKNSEITTSLLGNMACGRDFENQEKCNSAFATTYRWEVLKEVCPTGWRIPSEADFLQLIKTVGNDEANGNKLLSAHESINMNRGTNETGFSAIPNSFHREAIFWSNSTARDKDEHERGVVLLISSTQFTTSAIMDISEDLGAVRCIKILDESFYDETEKSLLDYRDGQLYKTTTIEDQVWLAQNLRYVYVDDNENPVQNRAYSINKDSIERYGRHYAWAAAVDSLGQFSSTGKGCGRTVSCNFGEKKVRGICPAGWHLPDTTEFQRLITSYGGYSDISALKATESYTEYGYNGTNKSGFNAYAAGQFNSMSAKTYANMYSDTYFWTTAEDNDVLSEARTQSSTSPENYAAVYWFNSGAQTTSMRGLQKSFLYSVRCVKD